MFKNKAKNKFSIKRKISKNRKRLTLNVNRIKKCSYLTKFLMREKFNNLNKKLQFGFSLNEDEKQFRSFYLI